MTQARELGTGPHRPFGAALKRERRDPLATPPLVTARPIRPRGDGKGRCPVCRSRFFGCGHDGEDE